MTNLPFVPETAPFTAEQRAWLNGFLAGLFANGLNSQSAVATPAPGAPQQPLLVLFGSQTGTAEGLARRLATQAGQRGFAARLLALNDFKQADFSAGGQAIFVSRTWGDGDLPDNAVDFWSWISGASAPRLDQLRYAVLGLGDRNYADFCGASKKIDVRLAELGAQRLLPRAECDVDYEADASQWLESLWPRLTHTTAPAAHLAGAPSQGTNGSLKAVSSNGTKKPHAARYDRHNPFPARLVRNVLLNRPNSAKEVRHYELDVEGSGLTYEVGDALGVFPVNCPELVSELIEALNSTGEASVIVAHSKMTLFEALSRHLDITKPSPDLVAAVSKAAPQTELGNHFTANKPDEIKKWIHGRGVIDLLKLLPKPFSPFELLPLLKNLAPRLYSISSSPRACPNEVHLTVSSVRYQSHGLVRKGVASTFLADRAGAVDFVKLYVQPSSFKPPPAGETAMIMIGPGTGIAPFRAFLQDRQATGASGRNWLFFGDQTRAADFLYESELTAWQKEGHLNRLDLAFSRDQSQKLYVQHLMMENAAQLWAWLDQGAHVYVCGDASRMARDVDEALHKIIETAGDKTADQAKEFVARLRIEKRYQRDVY